MDGYAFTPYEAGHVLFVLNGREGLAPGSFITALIVAIAKADYGNQEKLKAGFPGYVDAVRCYQRESGGVPKLRTAFMVMAEGGTG
jgi:hypothetical protein